MQKAEKEEAEKKVFIHKELLLAVIKGRRIRKAMMNEKVKAYISEIALLEDSLEIEMKKVILVDMIHRVSKPQQTLKKTTKPHKKPIIQFESEDQELV